jgi:hypothetical protein
LQVQGQFNRLREKMINVYYHLFYTDGSHDETEAPEIAKLALRDGNTVIKVTFITAVSGKTRITTSISTEIELISEI